MSDIAVTLQLVDKIVPYSSDFKDYGRIGNRIGPNNCGSKGRTRSSHSQSIGRVSRGSITSCAENDSALGNGERRAAIMFSSSFLFEGLSFLLKLITLLSKKYNPVTAKFDFDFLGFSISSEIFLFLILATPYSSGLLTGCNKTLHPDFNFTHSFNFVVICNDNHIIYY